MMEEVGLYEHETKGEHFTWSERHINGTIYSQIDRVICNREWFISFPSCDIEIMLTHISDHNPLNINIMRYRVEVRRFHTFKFLNCVVDN